MPGLPRLPPISLYLYPKYQTLNPKPIMKDHKGSINGHWAGSGGIQDLGTLGFGG